MRVRVIIRVRFTTAGHTRSGALIFILLSITLHSPDDPFFGDGDSAAIPR